MANQIIIDIGAMANDGTGDPLRTAFNYVNDNFSNVWNTGLPSSNVTFSGNKILTVNTNGNLVLAPNGIGKVVANVDIRPNANNTLSLGSPTLRWNSVYAQNLDVGGDASFNSLTVNGNLTVAGNIIEMGSIVTDAKTIQLANSAANASSADGSGITVGANDNIATMLYNSTSNAWTVNIGVSAVGNISAPYFIGNGSLLTGLPATYSNSNATALLASFGSNTISTTGNIAAGYFVGNGSLLTGISSLGNLSVVGSAIQLANNAPNTSVYLTANGVSGNAYVRIPSNPTTLSDGLSIVNLNGRVEIKAKDGAAAQSWYFQEDGSLQLPGDVPAHIKSDNNVVFQTGSGDHWTLDTAGVLTTPGNIIPDTSNVYSLGNSTNQWKDLWVSNATIYMDSVPISLTAGNVLTVAGQPVLSNDSNTAINTTGNITAGYLFGNGSQLTGITSYTDSNVTTLLSALGPNTISSTGNITTTANIGGGNISGTFVAPATTANTYILYNDSGVVGGSGVFTFNELGNILTIGTTSGTLKVADISTPQAGVNLRFIPSSGTTLSYGHLNPQFANTYDLGSNSSRWNNVYANVANIVTMNTIGNITGGNILTGGIVSAIGNITGNYIFGNGSQLTGLPASYSDSNVTSLLSSLGSNTISSTANIATTGRVGAGTDTPAFNLDAVYDVAGLGRFSFSNPNASMTQTDVRVGAGTNSNDVFIGIKSGNTFIDDRSSNGLISIQRNGIETVSIDSGGNIIAQGSITATNLGNISSLNLNGNASQVLYGNGVFAAVAGGSSYGDSNVATFLAAYGSNTISTSGNITAGNIIGNISITGNVTGTSSNVSLVAGSYTWTFDNAGNLALPGNSFTVNYANGTAVSLAGTYGNASLANIGSNTISTTGNISSGNLLVSGLISATANVTGGNILTAGSISATGNITGGNLITTGTFQSANIASTGNITSGNASNIILGNATSYLKQNGGNSSINLNGSITLTPDTAASSLNGVLIGGNGYLLAPGGARVLTLVGNNSLTVAGNLLLGGSTGYSRLTTLGETATGANAIVAGQSPTILGNSSATFTANVNNYTQITFQNKSTGTDATADYILTADNGNDTVNYSDFGIINSGYDNGTPTNSLGNIVFAADTYVYAQGNVSNTSQSGGNLVIGTTTATKNVKIFAGGNTASALVANISNIGMSLPTTPAFRVYGSAGADIAGGTVITATQGATVDYNQGSYYNNTTGLFTAPIAGLYQASGTVRVGSTAGLNQAAILKNNTLGGANVVGFWEVTGNATVGHMALAGSIKLAVGDTLSLKSIAGNIQFDSNDSWSVTFLG